MQSSIPVAAGMTVDGAAAAAAWQLTRRERLQLIRQ